MILRTDSPERKFRFPGGAENCIPPADVFQAVARGASHGALCPLKVTPNKDWGKSRGGADALRLRAGGEMPPAPSGIGPEVRVLPTGEGLKAGPQFDIIKLVLQ